MRKLGLLAATALGLAAVAYAQGPPPPDGPPPMGGPLHHPMFIPGPGGPGPIMRSKNVVKGVPYSATATTHFTQTLADGNTIQRTTTTQVARDSEGRTYTQQTLDGGPWASAGGSKTIIFIDDPVGGYNYVLHPDEKLAIRRAARRHAGSADQAASGKKSNRIYYSGQKAPNVVETDLGSKDIPGAGVAEGKSITHTIAAGEIGNAQPIVSTSEVWYSPDLQAVVLSKHNDPRTGESTYSLSNIQRAEPNASLFQVPSGYTVKDASNPHGHPGPPE